MQWHYCYSASTAAANPRQEGAGGASIYLLLEVFERAQQPSQPSCRLTRGRNARSADKEGCALTSRDSCPASSTTGRTMRLLDQKQLVREQIDLYCACIHDLAILQFSNFAAEGWVCSQLLTTRNPTHTVPRIRTHRHICSSHSAGFEHCSDLQPARAAKLHWPAVEAIHHPGFGSSEATRQVAMQIGAATHDDTLYVLRR